MRHAHAPARRGLRWILVSTLSLLPIAAPMAADTWDTPDTKWRSGPVKLLLTREEDQAYKKLKTDDERSRFVEEFWGKRDPSPGTPENEYREAFYRLAREATARFSDDGGKGWQDDRGKVFILLGPPDETRTGDLFGGTSGAGDPGAGGFDTPPTGSGALPGSETRPEAPRKTLKFVYFHDPRTGRSEHFELDFVSDVTGGYRLQQKLDWNDPFFKGLVHASRPAPPPAAAVEPPPPPVAPEMPAPPTPAPPEVTPQSELMDLVRGSTDLETSLPLDVTVNFYKAEQGTFATLTLEVKRSSLPAGADPGTLVMSAEILDAATGESAHRFFKADSFGGQEENAGAASGDVLLYQAERPINPGRYKAIFAVKEPASGKIGRLEKEIEVPSFESGEFQLSSVTLARRIEPLAAPPPPDKLVPFALGAFTVVPRPDNVYKEGEELSFYFQIYGQTNDPVTNAAKLDLSYAFEKKVAGQWRMVGGRPVLTPGQSGLVQAFSLPLRGWPSGEYRLSIKVTDTLANPPRVAAAELPFSLAGAPASKAKSKSKG